MGFQMPHNEFVPLASPGSDNFLLRDTLVAACARVIESGTYILGPEVNKFEVQLAESLAVRNAIGVSSGTDALALALLSVGVGFGDEVITVSHTAGPTVAAIRMIGAIPVLVDVDEKTYCLNIAEIKAALSLQTRAILAVHLYGHPLDIEAISKEAPGVPIIEDCAQAQGATLKGKPIGSFGDASCFSFYPTKNLGALGDGGAIVTNDDGLAERIRQLRTYGWVKPQFAGVENGRCSRLDEMQAAMLSTKLQYLDDTVDRRRAIAEMYREKLIELPLFLPTELPDARHAFHLYVLRSKRRNALEAHLAKCNIGTGRHYPVPVHKQPGLALHARIPGSLSVTELISGEILSIPIFATMTDNQVERVIGAVRSFFE